MILVIDAYKLVKGAGKSIGIYNLTKSLVEYLGAENVRRHMEQTIVVLGNGYNRRDMEREGVQFVSVPGNPLSRLSFTTWELFRVKRYLRRYQADRVLFPRGYRPLVYHGDDTIIVHDLIPFWYDEHEKGYLNRVENAYIMNRLKASIRRAAQVITISDYSRDAIEKLVPGSLRRIRRIYNGINDIEPWDEKAGDTFSEGNYIAAVTSRMPHKNAAGILAAYSSYVRLCSERAVTPLDLHVVGIGDAAPYAAQGILTDEAAAHVQCRSYLAEYSDLCRMIAHARLFLFLSLVEGFGFPPLEAMQLDTPVVCSDRTSLQEVVSDAGVLVDPEDPGQAAEAMLSLQNDPERCETLVKRGRQNIRRFSWDSRTGEYWEALFGRQV